MAANSRPVFRHRTTSRSTRRTAGARDITGPPERSRGDNMAPSKALIACVQFLSLLLAMVCGILIERHAWYLLPVSLLLSGFGAILACIAAAKYGAEDRAGEIFRAQLTRHRR